MELRAKNHRPTTDFLILNFFENLFKDVQTKIFVRTFGPKILDFLKIVPQCSPNKKIVYIYQIFCFQGHPVQG